MFRLLLVFILALAAVLGLASTKPNTFMVMRSIRIRARAEDIFVYINDLRRFAAWSPWERKDPAMHHVYSDPSVGVGASHAWSGNRDVGQGEMTIVESEEAKRVAMKLHFIKPIEAHNTAEFVLEQQGNETLVTWRMQGKANLLSKIMQLFMSMDKMVGKDFEAGLQNLRQIMEQAPEKVLTEH